MNEVNTLISTPQLICDVIMQCTVLQRDVTVESVYDQLDQHRDMGQDNRTGEVFTFLDVIMAKHNW